MSGLTVELARHALGPRHRGDPRRGARPGARRSLRRAGARAALRRGARGRPGDAADRLPRAAAGARARSRIRTASPRSATRASCSSRSATRSRTPRRSTPSLAEAARPRRHLPRPAGRPGRRRSSTSSRSQLGREVEAHDVEPLTWALAEIGRERSAGRYLGTSPSTSSSPGRSPAGTRAASTCC